MVNEIPAGDGKIITFFTVHTSSSQPHPGDYLIQNNRKCLRKDTHIYYIGMLAMCGLGHSRILHLHASHVLMNYTHIYMYYI